MAKEGRWIRLVVGLALSLGCGVFGCAHTVMCESTIAEEHIPRELEKQSLPDYVVEPPDILVIDALSVVPNPPYRVSPMDALVIQANDVFKTDPIGGLYQVETDGTVNLGSSYGSVKVVGMTLSEAQAAVEKLLAGFVKTARVTVSLGQSRGLQQIRGQHLVTPDGKVRLGTYGAVRVTGMTVPEVKLAIERHLTQFLQKPEVSVDVVAYNSKVYYVIFDGGGNGQQVTRLPVTGNDTVLDAISQVGGLNPVSSTHRIWVSRPAPANSACDQIMPVDWVGVTTRGRAATNYQLLPGDRLYVQANPLVTTDTYLARIFAPVERVLGITLLGTSTYHSFSNTNGNSGSGIGR